jgi:transposase-like protein
MKKKIYNTIVSHLEDLNYKEFKKLKGRIEKIDDKKRVAITLESNEGICCGHCGAEKFVKYGRRNDLQRYKCKKCNKTFNQLTGTPLARLRKKGRWLIYSDCLNQGYSLKKSALLTGVADSTSFRWRHRMLANLPELAPSSMNGVVECSETYFPYSEKGTRNPSEYAVEVNKNAPKVYVLSNRDRGQNVFDNIIWNKKIENVEEDMMKIISKDILFVSNDVDLYNKLANKFKLRHGKLDRTKGEIVKKQVVHIRNISNYHRDLHDWMKRFNGVATKYLVNYLGWFRELDEHNMKTPILTRLTRAKTLIMKPYKPELL